MYYVHCTYHQMSPSIGVTIKESSRLWRINFAYNLSICATIIWFSTFFVYKQSITIRIKPEFYEMTQSIACMAINLFRIRYFLSIGIYMLQDMAKIYLYLVFRSPYKKKYKEHKFFYISLKKLRDSKTLKLLILAFFFLAYSFTNRFWLISMNAKIMKTQIFNELKYELRG